MDLRIRCTDEEKLHPVVLLPGFASSRLINWRKKDCEGFGMDVGDRVWLDTTHVLYDSFREACWVECMKLSGVDQEDPVGTPESQACKLRVLSSLDAITKLDPSPVIGPLTSIFHEIVVTLATKFNYDIHSIHAAPYDWRLPPQKLEERDHYFSRLKENFEGLRRSSGRPSIVVAHSMGNNVFLYFVEYVKSMENKNYQRWFDLNISAFFAVGAPLLGSSEPARALLSGITFGLPISEEAIRRLSCTYASSCWIQQLIDPLPNNKFRNSYGWAVEPVQIDWEGYGTTHKYGVESLLNGTFFDLAANTDPLLKDISSFLEKYYEKDPIYNPLANPPKRPPLKHVYVLYGVNEQTSVGYVYRAADNGFKLRKIIYEKPGGDMVSVGHPFNRVVNLGTNGYSKSGDGTVAYSSLSWGLTWLYEPNATMFTVENAVDDSSSRVALLRELTGMRNIVYGSTRYSSEYERENGEKEYTTIIEFERVNHREVIRHQKLTNAVAEEIEKIVQVYSHEKKTSELKQIYNKIQQGIEEIAMQTDRVEIPVIDHSTLKESERDNLLLKIADLLEWLEETTKDVKELANQVLE